MLATKPGTGSSPPPLSESGMIALVLGICLIGLALAHAIHLAVRARAATTTV